MKKRYLYALVGCWSYESTPLLGVYPSLDKWLAAALNSDGRDRFDWVELHWIDAGTGECVQVDDNPTLSDVAKNPDACLEPPC